MLYFQALRKIRKEKKVKIKDLAAFLGKSRFTIIAWENGTYSPGSDSDIRLTAQYLNVPISDISDLQELQIKSKDAKEQEVPGFNVEDFSSETTLKLKNLYDSGIELRSANTRLRNETAKYEVMLQNLPFIIYVKDKKLKHRYVNDKFLDIAGQNYSRDNIIGTSFYDIFDFKDQANTQNIIGLEQRVLRTKEKLSNQQIRIPGTNNKKTGLLTITPILDAKEEVEEIVCSIEDITAVYEEQERRKDLEAVMNKVNHMLWIGETVNGDEESFKYTFISNNVSGIYGFDKQELFKDNKLWLKIVHPKDIEAVNTWKEANDFPKKIEYRIDNPKKGVRWIFSEVFKEGENKFYGVTTDITEEKEKEREKEAILQTLNSADDAIKIAKIKDDDKEYIYVNKANKDLYELPISKIKSNPDLWKNFIHPDDKNKILSAYEKKQEGHSRLNYKLLFPDGKIKYIEEDIFREVSDGVLYIGSIKRDVTLEKKAEEENNALRDAILKEAEKQNSILRYAMDKVDKIVWVGHFPNKAKRAHENFEYFYVNDAVYDIYGLTKEEWAQGKWVELVPAEHKKLINNHAREEYSILEHKIIHKITGEIRWIYAIMYKHEGMYFGFISDITKQKREEQAKNEYYQMFEKVLGHIDKFTLITSNEVSKKTIASNVVFASDAFEKIFKVPKKRILENPEYIQEIVHPEDKKTVEKWHNRETKTGDRDPASLIYRIILPDGSFKWIESAAFSSGSLDGKPIRFKIITDITDKKEKELQNELLRYAMDRVDKVVWVGRYPDNVERAHKNFKYFYVNDAVYNMLGLTKEEFSQGKWVDLVCSEYKQLIEDHAHEEIPLMEFKIIHKITKEEKWINAIMYKHGEIQFGFVSDVTKQKEEELARLKTRK